ncbi:Crp/Fnr family transcriptional regulator [Saccharothrix violaceirubra]|uniref:CRP-like cAMP-binding protein n=1 Tax=Saccharothrix violaceirubra TaxID=413306 RepID=A0A7W7T2U4_9PSEU|nr:Crp/Fnr family transcriptional regulator [Saccharothrix violaceirubra]MBB4964320.1 CRP-like cAMP-binding protein [Saccharothrix violaceirubra]
MEPKTPGTFVEGLTPDDRSALLALGVEKAYRQGDVMLREGERTDHVVLLLRAIVKVTRTLDNGRFALLNIKIGGDLVGEMAALSGDPRSATVTACAESRVRIVTAADFRRYLADSPGAHLALDRMIMRTLMWADKRRVDFSCFTAQVRLARVLSELAEGYGRTVPQGVMIDLGLTQKEVGALIGVEEDTARKELRALRDRGVVRMGYRTQTIVDARALGRIAEGSWETR